MPELRKTARARYTQYAALPYRRRRKSVQIMLVTSRGARRWIIPKGWPKAGIPPIASASEEAYEEAGVSGKITDVPIGSYSYEKRLKSGETAIFDVQVYALEVTDESRKWPERKQRRAEWFKVSKAPNLVEQPGLRDLLKRFADAR